MHQEHTTALTQCWVEQDEGLKQRCAEMGAVAVIPAPRKGLNAKPEHLLNGK